MNDEQGVKYRLRAEHDFIYYVAKDEAPHASRIIARCSQETDARDIIKALTDYAALEQQLAEARAERDKYKSSLLIIDAFQPNPGSDPYPEIAVFCKTEARKALGEEGQVRSAEFIDPQAAGGEEG